MVLYQIQRFILLYCVKITNNFSDTTMKSDNEKGVSKHSFPKLNQVRKDPTFLNGIIGESIPFCSYSPNRRNRENNYNIKMKSCDRHDNSQQQSPIKKKVLKYHPYLKYQSHRNRLFAFQQYVKKYNPLVHEQSLMLSTDQKQKLMSLTSNPMRIVSEIQKLNRSERLDKVSKITNSHEIPQLQKTALVDPQAQFISFETCKDRCYATKTNLIEYSHLKKNRNHKNVRYSQIKLNVKFKYIIGPGNNSQIIRQILNRRKNWVEASENDTLYNLRWEQYSERSLFKKINFSNYKQMVNHFQHHAVISSKTQLLKTLKKVCKRNGIKPFSILPISFIFNWQQYEQLQQQMKRFVCYYIANHPSQSYLLKRQKQYTEIMKNIKQGNRCQNYSFEKIKLQQYPALSPVYRHNKMLPIQPKQSKDEAKLDDNVYMWIIKPSDYNRGEGIKLFNTLPELIAIIKNWKDKKIFGEQFIIQKYIEKPMLIDSRKFDIRVWMLVDSQLNAYFFQQGYIRTSSEPYQISASTINQNFIHLTNNAVQKTNPKYGIFEKGNQMSFDDANKYFGSLISFRELVVERIKSVCSLLMEACKKYFVAQSSRNSFQIFGLDFMIDDNKDAWLIEVNTNPCIELSSPLLQQIIPRMLDDAFKIVLDPIFKPSPAASANYIKYPIDGYSDDQNLWQRLLPVVKQKINNDQFQYNNIFQ